MITFQDVEKKKDENGDLVYRKSMIYDWLERIRKMGLEQSFLQKDNVQAYVEENELYRHGEEEGTENV